ncbi:unnamed protein product [Microthlaspi erraticum]|uniref:Uncharacterized protein n=1 Tax=Microthlaspi erraticum TaxID=1685480 RepID=A0A6D2ICC0_9BRAS|nr:unnamed protein product [Microthlaspi erraticum]
MDDDNPTPQAPPPPWGNDYTRYLTGGGGSSPRPSPGSAGSRSRSGGRSGGRSGSRGSPGISSSHTSTVPEQQPQQSFTEETPVESPPISQPQPRVRRPRPPLTEERQRYFAEIKTILDSPGHERLRRLDPLRLHKTFWFNDDPLVAQEVRSVFVRDFKEPHANWGQIPKHVIDRWFITFAHKFHWEFGYSELVREEFEEKVKDRLPDFVGRLKKSYLEKGDIAKPEWWALQFVEGLKAFWADPGHQYRSDNGRAARYYDPNGKGIPKHRSGQTSFRAR